VASTGTRDEIQRRCHDLRLEQQRVSAEVEKLTLEVTRVEEMREQDEAGIARRLTELEGADRTVGELARELEVGLAEFATRAEELEARRKVRDRVAEDRAHVLRQLREMEDERTRWTRLRDQSAEFVHEHEMKLQRVDSAREELATRIEREFSVSLTLPDALAAHGALVDSDAETRESAQREVEDLRRQMDRLGAVNLVALDQYEREAKRYDFLKTQKDDLEAAREQLRRTIRKINRTARTMFMETLERVRENFQRTFGTLFEGGQADIRLAGDEDPLHAPIEIVARPRGKRLSSISLMSSGERSLTAVAFLFAIYLVKPSPFCILDEVDAPLDDANIGRFLDMLKEVAKKTQFVMITHNKKTMEIADFMYGVTMEDPGISKLVSVHLGKGEVPEFAAANDDGVKRVEDELVMESSV
jgi:chromosome segregation protein